MEGAPLSSEADSDKKESKKKKKRAEHLGAFAVQPEQKEAKDKPKDIFELLSPDKEKEVKKEKADTEREALPEEELSDEERQYITTRLVEAEQSAETSADPESKPAIETFRHKIVAEEKDPDTAFTETLEELEKPEPEGDVSLEQTEEPQEFGEDEMSISLHEEASNRQTEEQENSNPETEADSAAGTPPSPPKRPAAHAGGSSTPGWFGRPSGNPKLDRMTPRAYVRVPLYGESAFLSVASTEGVIGYLIGRRRGRIKTEKKLLPVKKKLEQSVESLQQDLALKELQIRKISRERDRDQRQVLIELTKKTVGLREKPVFARPEAGESYEPKQPAEHLGHVVLEVEAAPRQKAPKSSEKPKIEKAREKMPAEQRIETMNRSQLLELSEKITIEGSTLRQIYETHLVGERGLRRLVKEFLRGGDIKKKLRQEIVEREIDFERDPILRDKDVSTTQGASASTNLQSLLKNADAALPAESEEAAFYRARAAFEADELDRQKSRQRVMDISMASIIAILGAVVAVLVFTR
jgi:hypothetical protein